MKEIPRIRRYRIRQTAGSTLQSISAQACLAGGFKKTTLFQFEK